MKIVDVQCTALLFTILSVSSYRVGPVSRSDKVEPFWCEL